MLFSVAFMEAHNLLSCFLVLCLFEKQVTAPVAFLLKAERPMTGSKLKAAEVEGRTRAPCTFPLVCERK